MKIDPRPKKLSSQKEGQGSRETGGGAVPGALTEWERADRDKNKFEAATRPEKRQEIAENLGDGIRRLYLQIREVVPPMTTDRVLEGDIRAVRSLVETAWATLPG
jgi:hypothetical protein